MFSSLIMLFISDVQRHFECSDCQRRFTRKDNLQRHTRTAHSKAASFVCSKCSAIVKRFDNFLIHQISCAKSSDGDSNQKNLTDTSSPERLKSHDCADCKLTFRRKQDLTRHMAQIHAEERKSYSCSDCDYETPYSNLLKRHKFRHHTPSNTFFVCPECKTDCETNYRLTKHRKNKCSSDQSVCKFCFMNFRSAVKLKDHFQHNHGDILPESLDEDAVFQTVDYTSVLPNFSNRNLSGHTSHITPSELLPSVILSKIVVPKESCETDSR